MVETSYRRMHGHSPARPFPLSPHHTFQFKIRLLHFRKWRGLPSGSQCASERSRPHLALWAWAIPCSPSSLNRPTRARPPPSPWCREAQGAWSQHAEGDGSKSTATPWLTPSHSQVLPLGHEPQIHFTLPGLRVQRLENYCDDDDNIYISFKHFDAHTRPDIRYYYPHFKAKETKAQGHLGNCPELFPLSYLALNNVPFMAQSFNI